MAWEIKPPGRGEWEQVSAGRLEDAVLASPQLDRAGSTPALMLARDEAQTFVLFVYPSLSSVTVQSTYRSFYGSEPPPREDA